MMDGNLLISLSPFCAASVISNIWWWLYSFFRAGRRLNRGTYWTSKHLEPRVIGKLLGSKNSASFNKNPVYSHFHGVFLGGQSSIAFNGAFINSQQEKRCFSVLFLLMTRSILLDCCCWFRNIISSSQQFGLRSYLIIKWHLIIRLTRVTFITYHYKIVWCSAS